MYAHRQIYDHLQAFIAVPPELQHRRTEVIFVALDDVAVSEASLLCAATQTSEASFAAVWDNEDDAAYDQL